MSTSVPVDRIAALRTALEGHFAPTRLEIIDDSAAHAGHAGAREGGHFRVRIVAEAFRGRSALQRHRLVYEALGDLRDRGIHALNIDAQTPEESSV